MDQQENDDVVLKVSSSKEQGYAKKVAGAISWRLRETGICKIRAIKMDAVNTSVKAIAIVNQRLAAAGMQFGLDPFFSEVVDGPEGTTAIFMCVEEAPSEKPSEFVEYKVSGKESEEIETKLAGAIAAPVRNGKSVRMRCIGPSAVYRGMYAATIAKGYIYPNGLRSIVVPTWTSMPASDPVLTPISLIQLEFWGCKISPEVP